MSIEQSPERGKWSDEGMRLGPDLRDGGFQSFLAGTCSEFVEYVYTCSGLPLVHQNTRDPTAPGRLPPAVQIHAFWTGRYNVVVQWHQALAEYPTCCRGPRSAGS
jgi:hypothetical protein